MRSSATGGAWVTILAWNEDHYGPLTVNQNISEYADNQPDLQIRFNYDTKGYEWLWYWEVDNVEVCGASEELAFDTGKGTYPSISGMHNGTITPAYDINVSRMYTYPCTGTGGHTESVHIWGDSVDKSASWTGYGGDWHNITFDSLFVLEAGKTYNYTIITGSYPLIHHTTALPTANGWINCTKFTDANGKEYDNWIPAIRLE